MNDLSEHQYIDTPENLAELCASLRSRPYIAIDTEFKRERTYRAELCLIQIKHQEILACIDTLSIKDLTPLVELLLDESVTKVLHAATQDLEIFFHLAQTVPAPLFDTQIAAPLLGHAEQVGYGTLVNERLGIELEKTHTRADWTRRPLPLRQIQYALDDVIYLESLYIDMHSQLKKQNRLSWLEPEFAEQSKAEKYNHSAEDRWKKIHNVHRYKGPSLSIIQQLAKWREIKASEIDLPRNWLIKDDVIIAMAQQQPDSIVELGHIRNLDSKTRTRFGEEILDAITNAMALEPHPLPERIRKQKLTTSNLARMQLLNAWVHQRAGELGIAPSLLAPQKLLEKIVTGEGREAIKGWRDSLIGDDLERIVLGKAYISMSDQGLTLTAFQD